MVDINPEYEKMIPAIKQALAQDEGVPSVALAQFLTQDALNRLEKALSKGWKHEIIPDRYSYSTRKGHSIQKDLAAFAKRIAGKAPLPEGIRCFGHRDYTLLHDEEKQKAGFLCYLFLGEWDEGCGGRLVFVKDGETLASFVPAHNTLVIARRARGTRNFIKYVNHHARDRSFIIISG